MGQPSVKSRFEKMTVLVTGANSGLGYEASAQFADAGYGTIILACRTLAKAEDARKKLITRVGRDPFETLAVDVSDIGSANRASGALIKRGGNINSLLLNAGIVPGDQMHKTGDDIEMAFASSIIGHHIIANRLLEANIVAEGGRIVIAGSEAARNDLPAAIGMELYDFAVAPVSGAGTNLHDALTAFARGTGAATFAPKFNGFRYYAVTKLFTTWWAARMAEKYADRVSVFAVSPGSTMNTNVGRNIKGLQKFIFTKVMPVIGLALGMHQPAKKGAKRYLDVLNATNGQFKSGRTYTSRRKKLVGPMEEQTYPHMLDIERQNIAWTVLGELTGNVDSTANAA